MNKSDTITNLLKVIVKNKVLAMLTLVIILAVLTFDVFHYSKAFGIIEINTFNALLIVPFIVLVFGLGILLGTHKQKDDFAAAYDQRMTKREKEVIKLVRDGKTNQEIADLLFIDISTVKTHMNKIYKKAGVKSRKQLIETSDSVLD